MTWKTLIEPDEFNLALPLLRRKRSAFEIEDAPGLWRIHWQLGNTTLLSTFYTRIDQACLLWGVISAFIFIAAQFLLIDWQTQAVLWTGATIAGTIAMIDLAQEWRSIKPLRQVIDAWTILMLAGVVLTDLSIFLGWGELMAQLCSLWLVLDGVGYLYTGAKMRSRAFAYTGLLNLVGVLILPSVGAWQFLTTGLLTGLSALLLAEFQWDSGDICAHLKEAQLEPR